ncbi:hypothetical protein WJX79_009338 [Trebouxia sp. C0005]
MAACIRRLSALSIFTGLIAAVVSDVSVKAAPRRMLDSCTGWSEIYDQCGGISCKDGGTTCSDTAYNCCPTETSCQRQNQWYWQCLPEPVSPTVQAAPTGNTSPQSGQYPATAYQSFVTQWPSSECQVVTNNANYPNGLQCQGVLPDPACCSGPNCNVYQYWNASAVNTAFATSSPGVGLASPDGACYQDYLLGCCPPVQG